MADHASKRAYPAAGTPQACTIAVSVIAALPFTGIPHLRFSANAEPDAGLECSQETACKWQKPTPSQALARSAGAQSWKSGTPWAQDATGITCQARTSAAMQTG